MSNEYAFEMAASAVRFGAGTTRECGFDLANLGAKHVLVFADPALRNLYPVTTALESLETCKLPYTVFDRIHVEPTGESFADAIRTATETPYDAVLAVGGGSTIDTAKAANLFACWPADFLDYVNAPIGKGKPVPGPVKPLVAVPTTAGTGSETTGIAIFDYKPLHVKTGIAHKRLKPALGIIDPENTRTLPPAVAASSGLDVLCHAIESYTAIPYGSRPKPENPTLRPPYQGSNPISDLWSLEALRLTAKYLRRAVADPSDDEARGAMLLASTYAGIGFGHAGVHLPHAMSYPIAGLIREWIAPGYHSDHAMVPHGISVILSAPAIFRFTAEADPARHLKAAEALGANVAGAKLADAGTVLSEQIMVIMRDLGMPSGLSELGYTSSDVPALVEGAIAQQRITKLAPRYTGPDELAMLFENSMRAW